MDSSFSLESAQQQVTLKPNSSSWRRFTFALLVILHHALALAPLLVVVALYMLSWRGEMLIGHWPLPVADDPKYIAPDDLLYNLLQVSVYLLWLGTCYATEPTSYAIAPFLALTWIQRRAYPLVWTLLLIAFFVVGWLIFWSDPEARMYWFLD